MKLSRRRSLTLASQQADSLPPLRENSRFPDPLPVRSLQITTEIKIPKALGIFISAPTVGRVSNNKMARIVRFS
jgi:hypothetical protein